MHISIIESWRHLIEETSVDGLVCDVVISHTTLVDWRLFFDFVKENYSYEYYVDSKETALGQMDEKDLSDNGFRTFKILNGDFTMECLVLNLLEIEITAAPKQIMSDRSIEKFFEFITGIAFRLKKNVDISIEGYSGFLISFCPTRNAFFNEAGTKI